MREKRFVGYCTRCGGDSFDDGKRHYHRCPPKRPEADAVVALKGQLDQFISMNVRRPWAKTVSGDDYDKLLVAVKQMREAVTRAYP